MAQLDANTRSQLESIWVEASQDQNVSRETFSDVLIRLEQLVDETLRWQKAINLIAPKSIPEIWNRHILDSFQLIPYLPNLVNSEDGLIDLGSGGGFPGLVLAASGLVESPTIIRMIDSDQRKCQFLSQTSRKLGLKTNVITSRLEAYSGPKGSCLTARALAPLLKLLGWAKPMLTDDGKLVLLKGEAWSQEIDQARTKFDFDVKVRPSLTHVDARILIITNLSPKV